MTSILTNVAAMSALSTLRSISAGMEETQARVSSGLRVGGASDNAAYWSIATTMRSDNMALAAVEDALGLGAAKVDTAYAGMESAIEVVKEIKAKLVAATEDGVDKAKVQEEIKQLQDQLSSISEAASFSGENWLQADLSGGALTMNVVGSFVRDASGTVSVKKVNYDPNSSTILFDTRATGDKTGILDAEATTASAAVVLTDVVVTKDKVSTKSVSELEATGTLGTLPVNGGVNIESYTVGGDTYVRYYDAAGNIQKDDATGEELWARVQTFDPAALPADMTADDLANLDQVNGGPLTGNTTLNDDGSTLDFYYMEDQYTETVEVTGVSASQLTSTDGRVGTDGTGTYIQIDSTKDIWVKATVDPGTPSDVHSVEIDGTKYLIDETDQVAPAGSAGADLGFSVSDLDITDLATVATAMGGGKTQSDALDFMIQYVDDALELMTSAAADLGSISMRIDLQSEFVSKLTDSIDSGVGRLVDADMNEESTRLKALQTQQQLAIQSLSIANSASENILSLFR